MPPNAPPPNSIKKHYFMKTFDNLKGCFKESDTIPALASLAKLLPLQGELQAGVVVTFRHRPGIKTFLW